MTSDTEVIDASVELIGVSAACEAGSLSAGDERADPDLAPITDEEMLAIHMAVVASR